jgi:di/tricarboxylate transporter
MNDAEFDAILKAALAPPMAPADPAYVARVQANIALHETRDAKRRSMLHALTTQLIALAAVTAACLCLARAPAAEELAANLPWLPLLLLLGTFGLLGVLLDTGRDRNRFARDLSF